ncbi:MAG TPA: GIY-YIG nuclease family protein [Puia sp.]|nr:GIY-YIG nuclease family protein [Puia sp.]
MFFVYILYSDKLDKYYVGSTNDIDKRLVKHNNGSEKFTSTGMPWKLKYFEVLMTIKEARKRESAIKKKKSRKYIEWLIASW